MFHFLLCEKLNVIYLIFNNFFCLFVCPLPNTCEKLNVIYLIFNNSFCLFVCSIPNMCEKLNVIYIIFNNSFCLFVCPLPNMCAPLCLLSPTSCLVKSQHTPKCTIVLHYFIALFVLHYSTLLHYSQESTHTKMHYCSLHYITLLHYSLEWSHTKMHYIKHFTTHIRLYFYILHNDRISALIFPTITILALYPRSFPVLH